MDGGARRGLGGSRALSDPSPPTPSSPAKEAAPGALVNGVQPGKHENGFAGTGGSQELLELSHHGGSPGSIIPFGDKEPFLKQAVVKPPQVTGERQGLCTRGQAVPQLPGLTVWPHPSSCRGAVRARPALANVPAGSPHTSLLQAPAQNYSCRQKKHLAAPLHPPGPAAGGPGVARPQCGGGHCGPARCRDAWALSSFLFLFHFGFLF